MRKRSTASPRPTVPLGWRFVVVAAVVAVAFHLLLDRSRLPGFGAALFALAVPFALGGWAFHVAGGGRASFRRDVLLGVATGALACAIGRLVW